MSEVAFDSAAMPQRERKESYLTHGHTLGSWLLSTDHKRIAILYMAALTFFFVVASIAAALMRLQLLSPVGNVLSPDGYNRAFTLHGVIMVWFFLVPLIPTILGNFLLPLMIGATEVAFPRLNLTSWYIFMVAGLLAVYTILFGGVETGWTFYTPLSTAFSNANMFTAAAAVFVSGFSSIGTGVNFIATIHMQRAPGMTWFRLPLFVWGMYTVSIVIVLATPVLAMTLLLIMMERLFGLPIFDPARGGDPLLFQHMFWFYSHPAVYIMILPAFGVISEIVTCFARRRIFGYSFMVYAMLWIAVIGFLVWGHHMFVSGMSAYASLAFSFLSFVIAVPSAIKVFNWTFTFYRGNVSFDAPMLYAIGFIGLFTIGGLTGLFQASVPVDIHVTGTYFVVAHFHYIMVGGAVSAFYGGLHYWWPKMTGRMYPDTWARFAAVLMFFGFVFTFTPMFIMGWLGMPRRYWTYPEHFQIWHVLASAGTLILGVAYVLPMFYLGRSLWYGARAPDNPWQATGLEWQTTSPPPTHNFDRMPQVVQPPYQYHPEGIGPAHDEREPYLQQGEFG